MYKWLTIISFFVCIFISCQEKNRDNILDKTSYLISDNISNQHITFITEDEKGYIWLATARGLNRFNGYGYYQYFNENNDKSICGNKINSILKDSKNNLWVATENGICRFDTIQNIETIPLENTNYPPYQLIETQNGDIIANLCSHLCKYDPINNRFNDFLEFEQYDLSNRCHIDADNHLWIVSLKSIQCFEYPSMKFVKKIDIDKKVNLFYSYLIDNLLYVSHGKGNLQIIDTHTLESLPIPFPLKTHPVISQAIVNIIHPYGEGKYLISTNKNGLYLYDSAANYVIHQSDKRFPFQVGGYEITDLFTDTQGNLWIGTATQGFKVIYKYREQFNTNTIVSSLVERQSVTAIAIDHYNNLWVATYSDNLYIYNIKTQDWVNVDLKSFFPEDPYYQDKISSIHIGSDNTVWFRSEGKLIECFYNNNKLSRGRTFYIQHRMYGVAEDKNGTIWTATHDNFLCAITKDASVHKKVIMFAPHHKNYRSCLLSLSSGKVLVATSGQYLSVIDPEDWTLEQHSLKELIPEKDFIPTTIYEDSDKNIWIGVQDMGLFKYSLESRKGYKIGGIPCKDISSIIEDYNKNIWIGTLYGLSKYDPRQDKFFTFYTYDGIGGNQFNKNSVSVLSNGNLVFGGTHGLTIFDPSKVNIQRNIPLYFEDIKPFSPIFNNELKLSHNQNDLNISYVALDYSRYPRIRYYYMLEGFDNHWIDAWNNRQVSYSSLPPGDYTFKVHITSIDDSEVLSEKSIGIHISPSPWISTWAVILYIILFLGLIIYINKLYLSIKNNKNRAQIALREKEHEQYVNQMNMNFFSNISHEFRTPLTMIAGPITSLLRDETQNEKNKYLLGVINRSVTRMLRLVNQILSFNKLDNDALSLDLKYVDVNHAINEVIELFAINDNIKNITINTYGLDKSFHMLLDKDKLEKILNNVLSNAFKHSPIGGKINIYFNTISCDEVRTIIRSEKNFEAEDYIKIIVEDEGSGIPEDKLDQIFQRYYQIEHNSTIGIYNWGTGIGLYFARRLAGLHKGYIIAGNKSAGSGAVFTIIIPINTAGSNLIKDIEEKDNNQLTNKDRHIPDLEYINDQKDDEKYTILIIDDDIEISAYIQSILKEEYNVFGKNSADNAFDSLEEIQPDLILCDVVMPGTSGYDFCRKLKSNNVTSHISVVLLTAKSSLKEQIEGLGTGANAYIPKPFDPDYLLAVIKSQLLNLQNTRDLLANSTNIPKVENILSEIDNKFMTSLYSLMESELNNSEINISYISKEMGMSRTKFYLKMKGLTGESPNILFRKYKLNRALELIKSGNYNMTEIADMTGFSTLSHFSVSFKKQFGINPSEYKENKI